MPASVASAPAGDVVLRAEGLTKRFGGLVAVEGLSFSVRRGEVLGFLGPNGAGKTTTLRMLCGLLSPDAGRVEVLGEPRPAGRAGAPRAVGVSPQSIVIWETLTCREQLEFAGRIHDLPRAAARRRADELLAAFGLEEKRDQLGRTLSGGMQRRLNIALALAHEPEIVFLDEPQAGLDPQSRVLVREHIRSLAGRTTVIVTTHDMDEAEKLSDRVCIVDHGRLLAHDTVEAIKGRLGEGDLYELELGSEAASLVPRLEELRRAGVVPSCAGRTLAFTATDGAPLLAGVLREAHAHGARLLGLRVRRATLEDVFIRMTGRGLRE